MHYVIALGPTYAFHNIYRKSKWQDNVKEFYDSVHWQRLVEYKYM